MTRIPIYDDTVPITCTASREEIPVRIETVERMRSHLQSLQRTDDGVLLTFPPTSDVEAEVHQFTIDEKRCCQFWGFEIERSLEAITLRWEGPPTVSSFFEELQDFFESDQPLSAFTGLL